MYQMLYGDSYIFDPYDNECTAYDVKLSGKSNAADYLDFTIPITHPLYYRIKDKDKKVSVYQDADKIFDGYVTDIDIDTEGNKTFACTSILDTLNDTYVRPYSTSADEQLTIAPSSIDLFFEWLIDQHNKYSVGSATDFAIGVNHANKLTSNNVISAANTSYSTTATEINDKIISRYGGYFYLRYDNGVNYIDFYDDIASMNTQVVDFGINVTSFEKKLDSTHQYTAIIATGKTPEAPKDNPNKKMHPITLSSLDDKLVGYNVDLDIAKNGDAIYSQRAVARYGYKEYVLNLSDIASPEELLRQAVRTLNTMSSPTTTITVKAVDLSLYLPGYKKLRVGEAVRVRSALHDEDEYLAVESISLNLNNPEQSEYVLGAAYDTLTGQQSKYLKGLNSTINSTLDSVAVLDEDSKKNAQRIGIVSAVADDAKTKAEKANDDNALQDQAIKDNKDAQTNAEALQAQRNARFQEAIDAAKAQMDDAQGNLNAAIDQMEQNRQDAANATQSVKDDLAKTEASMHDYVESNDKALQDAVSAIDTVSDAANNAQAAADKIAGDLKATDVKVTETSTALGGLQTTMTTVKATADASLGLSSQHTQDIKGISDKLTEDYITKEVTLSKVSEVQKSANAISAKLTSDYTTTADADAKFSTKAELTATAEGIKSEVGKTYATNESVTSQVATVQQSAEAIALDLSTNYQNSSDIAKTYATQAALNATSEAITTEVSKKYATIATTDQLKNIADNAIETFMGSAVPTTSNAPAKDWNTDLLKKQHSGDIYYSTTDGKSYRYGNPDNTGWKWTLILDTDITKALQDASNAKDDAKTAKDGVTKLNTDLPLLYATKTNVSETAEAIKLEASETYATQKSLTDAKADIKLTTEGISANVSKNYQTTAIADAKYATQASLQITDKKIATSISDQAQVDKAAYVHTNDTIKTADDIQTSIKAIDKTVKDGFETFTKTTNELSATAESLTTKIQQTNDLATIAASSGDNLVLDPGFELGILEKNSNDHKTWSWSPEGTHTAELRSKDGLAHSGNNRVLITTDKDNPDKGIWLGSAWNMHLKRGHKYRISAWMSNDEIENGVYLHLKSNDVNYDVLAKYVLASKQTFEEANGIVTWDADDCTDGHFNIKFTYATHGLYQRIDDVSVIDVTDIEAAKEAQTDIANRMTIAEQNLDGFKDTVSKTYTRKSDFSELDSKASKSYAIRGNNGQAKWVQLGIATIANDADNMIFDLSTGAGFNGGNSQNSYARITIKRGYGSTDTNPRFGITTMRESASSLRVMGALKDASTIAVWVYMPWGYWNGNYTISGIYQSYSPTGAQRSDPPVVPDNGVAIKESDYLLDTETLKNQIASTYTTKSEFSQRADSIEGKVTASLNRNGGEMLVNGGFEVQSMLGWYARTTLTKPTIDNMPDGGGNRIWWDTSTVDPTAVRNEIVKVKPGATIRLTAKIYLDQDTPNTIIGFRTDSNSSLIRAVENIPKAKWTVVTGDITVPEDKTSGWFEVWSAKLPESTTNSHRVLFTDASMIDISDYTELSSTVTQTSTEWSATLNQFSTALLGDGTENNTGELGDIRDTIDSQSDAIDKVSDKMEEEITQREAYMQFKQDKNGDPLLELGASQNTNKVSLSNQKLSFMSENAEVAYISNKELHINNATIVQSLIIGDRIGFIPRSDGHLTLTRI